MVPLAVLEFQLFTLHNKTECVGRLASSPLHLGEVQLLVDYQLFFLLIPFYSSVLSECCFNTIIMLLLEGNRLQDEESCVTVSPIN